MRPPTQTTKFTQGKMMAFAPLEKWIADAGENDRVVDVAARTLQARLEAVELYLGRAAEAGHDVEGVHQLRVWTRRASAALSLYADLLPRRRTARLKKMLRGIRRTAGEARDCDIVSQRLVRDAETGNEPDWTRQFRAQRDAAQESLSELREHLQRKDRFERRVAKLLARIRSPQEHAAHFKEWAKSSLRPIVDRFFAAGASVDSDKALHRFRIRGKKLRYAMELLAAAFPPAFRQELYPVVEQLQDHLGEVSDLVIVLERLTQSGHGRADKEKRKVFQGQEQNLAQARDAFRAWWTPERRAALRTGFARMLESTGVRAATADSAGSAPVVRIYEASARRTSSA
jgi:CHAD domain-containing protein